ncbi:MAG: DEAD/DEAH box helicase family protein, partial [bacterium]
MTPNDLILSSSNWDEYFARLSALEKAKEKGDAFERFTQLYLLTAPKYRLLLKNVWKPDQDFGIDFFARTHQDQLWSIQAKFRSDTDSALTYKELSTFKTLSDNSENIDFCLVVHTSTKPIKNLHLLGVNLSTIGIDEFESIDSELWESIQSAARGEQKDLQPRSPFPHQQQAVEDIKEYFSLPLRTRGRVSMPCGSGKSLVGFWSALELKAESTVIVVPSLYLISQSIRVWSREILANHIDADFLIVCSDETTRELNTDELGGRVDELGVRVARTVEDIKAFLSKETTKKRIVFITYQSGPKLIEASSEVGFIFDLTILDEAHKTVGYRTKSFARLIVDEKYASTRYLFMTATERVLRGKNDEILSMADSEDYGELIHQLSFRACVEADPPIISDYRVVTLATSDSRVKEFIDSNPKVFAAGGEFDDAEFRDVAACLMLREFYKGFDTERTISFHSSIKKAEHFLRLYKKINEILGHTDIATFHISSKQSTGVRTRQVRDFTKAQKSHISNARCLTEGIDIPSVDSVLFADPKYSVVDIVQAAGRAMRICDGKQLGYIFLPIMLPDGVEFEEYSASSEYKQVLRVIAALAKQDERIVEQFQVQLLETDKPEKDKTKVVDFIGYQFAVDPEQLRQQIEVSISSFVGRKNYRSFEEAREYIKKLRLKTHLDYKNWARSSNRPTDIPGKPERIYKLSGWVSWPNWLGTEVSYL